MKHLSSIFVAACLVLPCSLSAAPLGFGDTVFLSGTDLGLSPELAGETVFETADQSVDPINPAIPGVAIGTELQSRVVEADADGSLIFGARIESLFNVTFDLFLLERLEIYGYGSFEVDADYRTDSDGDRGPTSATRSADGDTLIFDFAFPLVVSNLAGEPQENSYFLSMDTNASAYSLDGRASIFARRVGSPDDVFRFDFDGLPVPIDVAPVPLPSSLLLLIGALGFGRCLAMRRH